MLNFEQVNATWENARQNMDAKLLNENCKMLIQMLSLVCLNMAQLENAF